MSLSRRAFVLAGASATLATGARASDLAAQAVAVRTIDPADADFADLEPLTRAIGSARLVELGEPSHGAGSAFSAKARIVELLHRRLGFDVLIWESGFYDVTLAQAALRAGEDAMASARRGIFTLWSQAAEVRPLFEYVKASLAGPRPIEMAGFDLQVTADGAVAAFAADLRGFVDGLRDAGLRERAAEVADRTLAARDRLFASRFKAPADLAALEGGVAGLQALIRSRRADFDAADGPLPAAFMDRCLENMRADAALRFEAARAPRATPDRESRRDALNAANLLWLLRARYAGRKAIVWAHNAHVMKAGYAPGFHDVHVPARPGDMIPTGALVAQRLGREAYALGITAFAGREGFATGGPVQDIPPAPAGSLEARLHTRGLPYAFLDLRGSPDRRPETFRAPKFDSVTAPPSGVYDGVFFIDRMAPATRAS